MKKENDRKPARSQSLDELVKHFETHDLGDALETMPAARFTVNLQRRQRLFALDEETAGKLSQVARKKKTSSQKLINTWLKEKLREAV
jgi:hypothetical protein